jgi:hypothetical protein
MQHFGEETTIDYIEGRLADDRKQTVEEHLDSCEKCAHLVGDWREILEELHASNLSSAPPDAINQAIEIFPAEVEKPLKTGTMFASLVFDSFESAAFAGARGALGARQVLMRTENVDIDLHISQANGGHTLLWGQLLPRLENAMLGRVQVTLLSDGERIQSVRTNESGEFRFEDVPTGELSIGVYLPTMSRQVFGVFKIQRN